MSLSTEQLQAAREVVGWAPSLRDAVAIWRSRFPQIRALTVDASDMRSEQPALQLGHRSVYLAASDGHCWHVTQRPEEATALILTQH
ncbi:MULTISPECIES: hypothetical protein [Hydrogenophaga]|uniref:Uncharacterized protein n=1 Tax=Hydrogenophaga electricum TaxID=1230953 RepID=A0ABQ6CED2_9BURK|nr:MULTISPECIES: hypothetical protein [Hydrogenophaga]GLS16686.1 hypothetical protein GCM10007935_41290 [Hydrogenophaga electricum]